MTTEEYGVIEAAIYVVAREQFRQPELFQAVDAYLKARGESIEDYEENTVRGFYLGEPIKQSKKYGLKIGNGAVISRKFGGADSVVDLYGNQFLYADAVSGEVIGLWRKGSYIFVKLAIRTPGLGVTHALLNADYLIAVPF